MGTPFTYTITNNAALISFTATGLPAGLSLNTSTGVISGTPTSYGSFSVALTASNSSISGSQTIALTVYAIVNNVIVASGDAKDIIGWDPIQNFSYNIKRATASGGPYTTIGTVTATKFIDSTNVSNGNTYYYVVSAINTLGENPNSAEVVATPNVGQITYLKFDEPSGTRAIDSWGANHATLQATATRDVGISGSALKLDGTATAYATLPTGIVSTLNDFTISAWVRMDAKSNWMRIFDFGTGTSKYMFLTIQAGSANIMRYAIKNGGSEQQVSFNYNLPLNTWTNFVITQSGTTCSMYINKVLVATNTSVTIKPSTIGSTNLNYLGKSQFSDPMFKGSIDEFKIYSRALSASEIQNLTTNQAAIGTSSFITTTKSDVADTHVLKSNTASHIVIYPNPLIGNYFNIKLTPDLLNKAINLKIQDALGKIIQSNTYLSNDGTLYVVLKQNYLPGVYFVRLTGLPAMRLLIVK
jgi:hypothetical protein